MKYKLIVTPISAILLLLQGCAIQWPSYTDLFCRPPQTIKNANEIESTEGRKKISLKVLLKEQQVFYGFKSNDMIQGGDHTIHADIQKENILLMPNEVYLYDKIRCESNNDFIKNNRNYLIGMLIPKNIFTFQKHLLSTEMNKRTFSCFYRKYSPPAGNGFHDNFSQPLPRKIIIQKLESSSDLLDKYTRPFYSQYTPPGMTGKGQRYWWRSMQFHENYSFQNQDNAVNEHRILYQGTSNTCY